MAIVTPNPRSESLQPIGNQAMRSHRHSPYDLTFEYYTFHQLTTKSVWNKGY